MLVVMVVAHEWEFGNSTVNLMNVNERGLLWNIYTKMVKE